MNQFDRRRLAYVVSAGVGLLLLLAAGASAAFGQTSGTWQSTGTLNIPRTAHTATLLANGEVLVVGGKDSSGNILTTAELYNPTTGQWSTTGVTATPREEHTATLLANGEVLVAGGFLGSTGEQFIYTSTAELYNPSTGKWSTTGSMKVARARAAAALLPNGKVLVAGGSNSDGTSNTTSELYDPSTGKWTATGNMASQTGPATVLPSGHVLIAGGDTGQLYNPATGQWAETPELYFKDSTGTTAALLPNGNVLLYGNHLTSYTAQIYSPATNTWSPTHGLSLVNMGPLVTLADGNILLAGGVETYSGKSVATTRAGLYNLSINGWSLTGSLKEAAGHTATRLRNGQVLAVGGADAELYTP